MIYYMVMKKQQFVVTKDVHGKDADIKLSGCDGVVLLYEKEEDAIKSSCDGKYQILAVRIKDQSKKV